MPISLTLWKGIAFRIFFLPSLPPSHPTPLKNLRGGSRGRLQGVRTPPPWEGLRFSNTTEILQKKKTIIGVEVEQETSVPPPKKNPGSAPEPLIVKTIKKLDNNHVNDSFKLFLFLGFFEKGVSFKTPCQWLPKLCTARDRLNHDKLTRVLRYQSWAMVANGSRPTFKFITLK